MVLQQLYKAADINKTQKFPLCSYQDTQQYKFAHEDLNSQDAGEKKGFNVQLFGC